jgi:hypothetical protein
MQRRCNQGVIEDRPSRHGRMRVVRVWKRGRTVDADKRAFVTCRPRIDLVPHVRLWFW